MNNEQCPISVLRGEFDELDRFIGAASREAEQLGFHYWSVYVTKDTNGKPALAMPVVLLTNDGKSVRAIPAFYFGEDAFAFIGPRLRMAKLMLDEDIKSNGLEIILSPRGPTQLAWAESLKFAPAFFVKEDTRVETVKESR